MWKVALYILLIPFWATSAWKIGETCHKWIEGIPIPVEIFLCPEKSDGADAHFCCGTCSGTYCCSSLAARLDQRKCFRDALPTRPTTDGTPTTSAPDLLYTMLPLALAVSLTLGCFALVHYSALKYCVGDCRRQQEQIPATVADLRPVFSPEDPARRASLDLPPPPYNLYETHALPCSLEDPTNWDLPPPYPGDSLEFQQASPGVPGDWAVAFFPMGGPSGQGPSRGHPRKPAD